jgi:hypothetical protein
MEDLARILTTKIEERSEAPFGLLEDDVSCTGGLSILSQVQILVEIAPQNNPPMMLHMHPFPHVGVFRSHLQPASVRTTSTGVQQVLSHLPRFVARGETCTLIIVGQQKCAHLAASLAGRSSSRPQLQHISIAPLHFGAHAQISAFRALADYCSCGSRFPVEAAFIDNRLAMPT